MNCEALLRTPAGRKSYRAHEFHISFASDPPREFAIAYLIRHILIARAKPTAAEKRIEDPDRASILNPVA